MDQIALGEFLSPAVGAGVGVDWDLTLGGITEPARAAVLLYSASDVDDTDHPHARVGVSLVSSESSEHGQSQCVLARDGLTTPDCRTAVGSGLFLYVPRNSAFANQFDQANTYDSAIAGGFRFTTSIDPLVRSRGAALILAGTGMRSWALQVQATTTLQGADCGPTLPSDDRFRPHLLVVLAKDGAGASGQQNDATMALGFVVDDGSATQVVAFTDWDDATEPSDADAELRDGAGAAGFEQSDRSTRVLVTFGFTSTGITYQANVGTLEVKVLAVRFESSSPRIFAGHLELDGSSPQPFVLPFDPLAVLALSSLLGAVDSPDGTSLAGSFGLSLFGPSFERSYAARFKQGESTTSDASFRQEDAAVLTLDHLGSVEHRGNHSGPASPRGFELTFSTSGTGHLTVLALGDPNVVDPDPIELALVLPPVVLGGLETPPAIALPLLLPAPLVVLPQRPPPVALALVLPAPQVFAPPSMATQVPPDLGPLYAASLSSLLPRGLAWPRRSS